MICTLQRKESKEKYMKRMYVTVNFPCPRYFQIKLLYAVQNAITA